MYCETHHLGAFSKLIQYDKRPCCGIADGSSDLVEVNGECRQLGRYALSSSHACKDLVNDTNLCRIGRHIASNVSHEHDQTNLQLSIHSP